jgi:hypothetical protein
LLAGLHAKRHGAWPLAKELDELYQEMEAKYQAMFRPLPEYEDFEAEPRPIEERWYGCRVIRKQR